MDEETTKNLAYIISIVIFVLMARFVLRKGLENRSRVLRDNAPKIAGDDELDGAAKNPQQFDEPDDEALDEMAKLLGEEEDEKEISKSSTVIQNITYNTTNIQDSAIVGDFNTNINPNKSEKFNEEE